MTQPQKILIVSEQLNEELRQTLIENKFETSWTADPEAAFQQLTTAACDLLIIDLADARAATDFVQRVRNNAASDLRIITIAEWGTGQPTLALSFGADTFERKPIEAASLLASVKKLLRPRRARRPPPIPEANRRMNKAAG